MSRHPSARVLDAVKRADARELRWSAIAFKGALRCEAGLCAVAGAAPEVTKAGARLWSGMRYARVCSICWLDVRRRAGAPELTQEHLRFLAGLAAPCFVADRGDGPARDADIASQLLYEIEQMAGQILIRIGLAEERGDVEPGRANEARATVDTRLREARAIVCGPEKGKEVDHA